MAGIVAERAMRVSFDFFNCLLPSQSHRHLTLCRPFCQPSINMRTGQLASALLLAASATYASPVRQHPIVHKEGTPPYTGDNRDPYDHKIDSWKEDIQPLPIVSLS